MCLEGHRHETAEHFHLHAPAGAFASLLVLVVSKRCSRFKGLGRRGVMVCCSRFQCLTWTLLWTKRTAGVVC